MAVLAYANRRPVRPRLYRAAIAVFHLWRERRQIAATHGPVPASALSQHPNWR